MKYLFFLLLIIYLFSLSLEQIVDHCGSGKYLKCVDKWDFLCWCTIPYCTCEPK